MINRLYKFIKGAFYPSFLILFVTSRCNARCKMCFYLDKIQNENKEGELSLEDYEKISKKVKNLNIMAISGGEPFLREDLYKIVKVFYDNCRPFIIDIPTNGFLAQPIIDQLEKMLGSCKETVFDLQLSLDGTPEIHNEIRGVKDGYDKLFKTYQEALGLRERYKNLKVKIVTTYSSYNEGKMRDIIEFIKKDFGQADRIVLSVVHGDVKNKEAYNIDWNKYFYFCKDIEDYNSRKDKKDLYSIFLDSAREVKNGLLRKIIIKKNANKYCEAGKRIIVINENGEVFPCEPLWQSLGNIKDYDYDLSKIISNDKAVAFNRRFIKGTCTCNWGCAISNSLLYNPVYCIKVLKRFFLSIIK